MDTPLVILQRNINISSEVMTDIECSEMQRYVLAICIHVGFIFKNAGGLLHK
jgi:hypothetical protein